jgi:hypothetical protein
MLKEWGLIKLVIPLLRNILALRDAPSGGIDQHHSNTTTRQHDNTTTAWMCFIAQYPQIFKDKCAETIP